jgi:hypothetical protein
VVYLFPNCLDGNDMELMRRREEELSKIYKYAGWGFFGAYLLGATAYYVMRGKSTPFFRDMVQHSILSVSGTFLAALGAERLASELYYNKLLIQLSDKYNFTPEEVLDLQRNLNQYYIQKDREQDIRRNM